MTLLAFESWSGMAPKIHPTKLADTLAVKARNVRLDRGVLEGWYDLWPTDSAPYTTRSFYRYQGNWLLSSNRRKYVGNIRPNDPYDRIYYSDMPYPKFRSGASEYKLGLPAPATPSVLVVDSGDITNPLDVFQTRYVVTLVDTFGHEGPPSLPTADHTFGKDHEVTVDLSACTVTGQYALGAGAQFYIYRSNADGGTNVYQFVGATNYGALSFTDTVPPGSLQEELQSTNWYAAPDNDTALYPGGPLASLIEVPGGILAGHSGNTVFLSEPYVPTAWPYRYAVGQPIVGIVMIQGGILILTEGRPYLLTGMDPAAMAVVPVESGEACISAESIVDMGDYAIYAGPRGLMMAQGNSAELITGDFLDEESWYLYNPTEIVGGNYFGKYVGAVNGPGVQGGFIFDPVGGLNTLVEFSPHTIYAFSGNAKTSNLEVLYETVGAFDLTIGTFNEGERLSFTWKSKVFEFPDPVALSIIKVLADEYPVQVAVLTDGVYKGGWSIPDDKPVRLPGGYRANTWQFEFLGSGPVTGIYLADNMREIP